MPGLDFDPWTRYPALSPERLVLVGDLVRQARHSAVVLHEPQFGDNEWSLGCRVYSRICQAIRDAQAHCPWLRVLDEEAGLEFTFAIETVPFKFYHGDADSAPGHCQSLSYAELHHHQLCLELGGTVVTDSMLRLAVETDSSREVSTVTVVEMDMSGNLTGTYAIPLVIAAGFTDDTANITPLQQPGILLPPPPLEPLSQPQPGAEAIQTEHGDTQADTGTD
jgi:hypothetical protein